MASADPDRDRMWSLLWPLVSGGVWWLLLVLLLFGCAAPANRLAVYPEADVLFTTAAEVDRLCRLAPQARAGEHYRGCYIPSLRLAVVGHGDAGALAHELRHAREGSFHK